LKVSCLPGGSSITKKASCVRVSTMLIVSGCMLVLQ